MAKHVTVYASAARTATPTAATVSTGRYTHAAIVVEATAVTATPSVVMTIHGLDPASGAYYLIATSAAITAISTTYLRIGPGLTSTANLSFGDIVPSTLRITMTHGDADSITYSVGVNLY